MGGMTPVPGDTTDDASRDARLLAWDLACVAGASSEIATTWRRAGHDLPGLPLDLPEHLHDSASQLEATAWSIATSSPDQAAGQAALLARRVSALSDEAAAARAAGGGAGGPEVGDTLLWEWLTAALRDAVDHARQLAAR